MILSSSCYLIWHITHWLHWVWEIIKEEIQQPLNFNLIQAKNSNSATSQATLWICLAFVISYGIHGIEFIDFGEIRKKNKFRQCHFPPPTNPMILSSSCDVIWHILNWIHWIWEKEKKRRTKFKQCHFPWQLTLS